MRGFLQFMFRKQFGSLLGVFFVVVAGFFFTSRPAQADPHAMFYTVVGQQQLFFNVLAALDQADYVESATLRNQLLQARTTAGFPPSSDTRLGSTQTSLSNLLTRGVTLDGTDLWTAQQQFYLALEASRRNATDELIRDYCQHAVGLVGCDSSDEKLDQRDKAVVTDGVSYGQAPVSRGALAALDSNLDAGSDDQKKRRETISGKNQGEPIEPLEWSDNIARAREASKGNPQTERSFDGLVSRTKSSYEVQEFDTSVYDRLSNGNLGYRLAKSSFGSTNVAQAQSSQELDGAEFATQYIQDLMSIAVRNPLSVQQEALAAAQRVRSVQETSDKDGFRGDAQYQPEALPGGTVARIGVTTDVPAESKIASLNALKQGAVTLDANQTYAPPEGEHLPGQQPLVDRGQGSSNGGSNSQAAIPVTGSAVAGISDERVGEILASEQVGEGEVKGLISSLISLLGNVDISALVDSVLESFYDEPKEKLSPGTNPIAGHNEAGVQAALNATTPTGADSGSGDSGYSNQQGGDAYSNFCALTGLCSN